MTLAQAIARTIRREIAHGRFLPGDFLPSEHSLCSRFGVSRGTVRNALAVLKQEGLLESLPARGYRLKENAPGGVRREITWLTTMLGSGGRLRTVTREYIDAAVRLAMARGWRLRVAGERNVDPAALAREAAEGMYGILLDTDDPLLPAAVRRTGVPAVLVDNVMGDTGLDSVTKDNVLGMYELTVHLIDRGHTRIEWAGPVEGGVHVVERWYGARKACEERGGEITAGDLVVENPDGDVLFEDNLFTVLTERFTRFAGRADRPRAILCPWHAGMRALYRAACRLGLAPEDDVVLAGWATELEYEHFAATCGAGPIPATAVWNPADMVRIGLERIEKRAAGESLPPCRINVMPRVEPPRSPAAGHARAGAPGGRAHQAYGGETPRRAEVKCTRATHRPSHAGESG